MKRGKIVANEKQDNCVLLIIKAMLFTGVESDIFADIFQTPIYNLTLYRSHGRRLQMRCNLTSLNR